MSSGLFEERLRRLAHEGGLCAFNVACVAEATDIITALADAGTGGETVEVRQGEYKIWDPEIFRADKDAENEFIRRLKKRGSPVLLLSEEAGRLEINMENSDQTEYAVADPLDGSFLFRQGIRNYWFSALGFFDSHFNPLTCAVGDVAHRRIAFANNSGAYAAKLVEGGIDGKVRLGRQYRAAMGRKEMTSLEGAAICSYAMKPDKFLMPLVDQWRELLRPFKFFLPTGGPSGFWNVAEGWIDVYFAPRQPFVDIFSGIQIGLKAETVVTDFDGEMVQCDDDYRTQRDVLCSSNRTLHDKVLQAIADCRRTRRNVR